MGTPAVPSGPSNVVCFVVLRFGDAPMRVVTNVVNRRCFLCGFPIRCYKRRQSDGFFAENSGFWTQIDDVCNMSTRKGGSNCSGLTTFVTSAARWLLGQVGRLSETPIAFAGADRASTETAIAFAGEK